MEPLCATWRMVDYRLFLLTDQGRVGGSLTITAETDDEAITLARGASGGAASELWLLGRMVAHLDALRAATPRTA